MVNFAQLFSVDAISTLISLSSTLLSLAANILHWPIGIVSYFVSGYLYATKGLYSNVILEVAYLIVSLYGFKNWIQNRKAGSILTVQIDNTPEELQRLILICIPLVTLSLYFIVTTFFHVDHATALKDAFATSVSLPALWLMGRRYVECWILWFISDVMHSYLYFQKGLFFKGNLHAVYLGIAIWGYFAWKSKLQKLQTIQDIA